MRYARQPVELDSCLGGDAREPARRVLAQIGYLAELAAKSIHGSARRLQQSRHLYVARGTRVASAVDLGQTVIKRFDQQAAAFGVWKQVVLKVRVAMYDPDEIGSDYCRERVCP